MSENEIRLRPMQLTDCAQVAALAGAAIDGPEMNAWERRFAQLRQRMDQLMLVAVDDLSRIWGWVHVVEVQPLHAEPQGLILRLKESEEGIAHDVGKRLLKAAESWCQERGYGQLVYGSKSKKLEPLEQSEEMMAPLAIATWSDPVIIYTDGASRGNPGMAAIGVYVTNAAGQTLAEMGEVLGRETNNVAEYTALVRALELARDNGARDVLIRADSELMIRQMKGEYQVKSEGLRPLFERCRQLARGLGRVRFEHVRREFNKVADGLANQALDSRHLNPGG